MDVPYSLFVKAERAVENEEINPRTGDPYDNVDQFIEAYLKGYKEEDFKYKAGGRVGLEFGGIPAAVEAVEEKPKEFLVDKLKVTIMPGQSEEMGILNAMFNDVEGVMPDDRKMEFYKLYIPQLYERGEISKAEFEGMKEDILGEGKKDGGLMSPGRS